MLYARELTGEEHVHAVVGGFHLEGAGAKRVRKTVKELLGLGVEYVFACHCTGLEACCELKRAFGPERFGWPGSGDVIEVG